MAQSSLIRRTGTFALLVLLLLSYLFARLDFQHQKWSLERHLPTRTNVAPPEAEPLEALSLNHPTLAADIVWIWAVVYYGERHNDRQIKYLDRFAETISQLDPRFYDVYSWFSTTYINSNYPPSHADLQKVRRFLERGMNYFPTDYRLPHEAGLNYIGFSAGRPDHLRIEELTNGIRHLERAAKLDDAPDVLPFTISWMYQRRRQLREKSNGEPDNSRAISDREIEFLAEMYYLVDSESNRQRIAQMLGRTERGRRALSQRGQQYSETLEQKRLTSLPYLPVGLWTLVNDRSL